MLIGNNKEYHIGHNNVIKTKNNRNYHDSKNNRSNMMIMGTTKLKMIIIETVIRITILM
jgi:hypothetical protein